MLSIVLSLLAIAAACVFVWHRRTFSYWRRRNIPHQPPRPFVGNFLPVLKAETSFPGLLDRLHNNTPGANKDTAVVGLYSVWRPTLLLRNIDLIKQIMIKDFPSFSNRSMYVNPHVDMLGANNLFIVRNPQWRDLRTQLTPVFTSGKMRQMYPLMSDVGKLLAEQVDCLVAGKATVALPKGMQEMPTAGVVDVKELCARFTMDVIASIAFGINANCLTDAHSEFYRYGVQIFEPSLLRALNFASALLLPSLSRLTRARLFPIATADFLRTTFTRVMKQREREFGGVGDLKPTTSPRNDLIDILLAIKWSAKQNKLKSLSEKNLNDYLLAQAAVFQTAGFETSSSVLTFALFELAWQPDLQDRLRDEIQAALRRAAADGEEKEEKKPTTAVMLTYEQLHEMQYLKQVMDEALRKYPTVPLIERCYTPQTKEEARTGYSLRPFADVTLSPGTTLYVSVQSIHRDSRYWPEPERFDPDRFAPEREHEINWQTYMPFGNGPRNCIGSRMGLLTTRLGLVQILRDHRVCVCDRTQREIEFDPHSLPLSAKGGVCLRFERIASI